MPYIHILLFTRYSGYSIEMWKIILVCSSYSVTAEGRGTYTQMKSNKEHFERKKCIKRGKYPFI